MGRVLVSVSCLSVLNSCMVSCTFVHTGALWSVMIDTKRKGGVQHRLERQLTGFFVVDMLNNAK